MLRISIITPSYNQAEFIGRTIDSVQSQRGRFELEHIVVDGGSTDETVDVLKSYGDAVSWISEPDDGQADALNKGVAMEMDSVGMLAFLILGLLGVVGAGHAFFHNFLQLSHPGEPLRLLSAGSIPLANVAIGLKVGTSLFMVFIILAATRVMGDAGKGAKSPDEGSESS